MPHDRNYWHELSLPGLYFYFWKAIFGGKLHKHLHLTRITLNLFALEKGGTTGFFAISFVVDILCHVAMHTIFIHSRAHSCTKS